MGARNLSKELKIFALSIFVIIFVLAFVPEALANSVSLSVDSQFQIADGYSTSLATATVYGAGAGETVDFNITDSGGSRDVTATTDSSGVASASIGPYPYGVSRDVDISATCNGDPSNTQHITFLAKNKFRILNISCSTPTVGTTVTVTAQWDKSTGIPADNVPLTFSAFDPNFGQLGSSQTITTDSSGIATYTFTVSDIAGYNWVTISLNGNTIKAIYVEGTGGSIDHFALYTTPVSPIIADGKTKYVLHVTAFDVKNNTVSGKKINFYKNNDPNPYVSYPTNSNGVIALNLGPSLFVQDIKIKVEANDTLASNYINISYIKGDASNVSIIANPAAVANANIDTVPGQADVHTTEIVSTLTDNWGHPISGERVYMTSMNSSLGSMWNTTSNTSVSVASGITDSSGQFSYHYRLASNVHDSDIEIGAPVMTWYNNSSTGVYTNDICYIRYTDKPFVVATTSYTPMSNISVNDTINVTVRLRAYGWINATNNNNSAMLVFDTSGSMDWLANTIYPEDGTPKRDYVDKATGTVVLLPNKQFYVGSDSDWKPIMDYQYNGDGTQAMQIMLSSDYRAYGEGLGSFYLLKVVDPNGNAYFSNNATEITKAGVSLTNLNAQNARNENFVKFPNAASGTYHIYGVYTYNSSYGETQYNLMVLNGTKRLGQITDLDSAAKVAGTEFVGSMDKNQVGVVWFNDSSTIPPVAKFTANPQEGVAPLQVQFHDASDNAPDTWAWSFGDTYSSSQPNPLHTYTTPGKYNVKLTVAHTASDGTLQSNSVTYTNFIIVHNPAPKPTISANKTSDFVPMTVQFNDITGDSSITGWLWNFGDGFTDTAKNPVHTYAGTGTYSVTLTATNDGGSGTSAPLAITVKAHNPPPTAKFTVTPTTGKVNVTSFSVTDTSTGSNLLSWSLDWGDGTVTPYASKPSNVKHTYAHTGTFSITMTTTNDGGSSTSPIQYVTVTNNPLPVPSFTASPNPVTAGGTVTFTDTSTTNGAYSWLWTWGDGKTDTYTSKATRTHKFTTAGTFAVTLTLTNDAGSATSSIVYITVNPAPTATPTVTATATATATPQPPGSVDFTGSPTTIYVGQSVSFTGSATNSPTSCSWVFGDGGTDSGSWSAHRIQTHTYNTVGVYTVTFTATNSVGSNSKTRTNYITVIPHNATPVADFIGAPTTIYVGQSVAFTDKSTGNNINSWAWNFGDTGTDTAQNPGHVYNTAGTYSVTLTVRNDNATAGTKTRTSYITVQNNPKPVADFTMSPASGNVPLTVAFTDMSTGNNIKSWQWNFSDGQWSTSRNPTMVFSSAGPVIATLTVTNDGSPDSINKTVTVTNNALPTAAFSGTPQTGTVPLTVQFTDASSGNNIFGYQWDFGDGTGNSTLKNPSHVYATQGVYSVTLTVTNDAGSSTTRIKNYIQPYNPAATIPPMLTGILANILRSVTTDVSAQTAPVTPPAGLASGLTTINGTTAGSVNSSIDILMSSGGTNIAAGITEAISEFNSANYTAKNKKYILLLTDGYSQYPDADIAAAQEAAKQNITIYAIGIGMPDDITLNTISNGNYRKVDNMPDLVNAFLDIARDINAVAGHNITMRTFTNYSNLTYTLNPDTRYVNGSSNVYMPDPITKKMVNNSIEPFIYEDDANHIYRLTWPNIGNLSYNQNMTITYQLKVTNSGNITPITNASYVTFLDDDGNPVNSTFTGPTLYVNGTPDNSSDLAPPDLLVSIVTPTENQKINSSQMLISWATSYTGSDTYKQVVILNNNTIYETDDGTISQPWQYTYTKVSDLPSGTIPLVIKAYDSYCNSTAMVNITIDPSGRIHLSDG